MNITKSRGFTLVELIMTIVIIGILAIFALPRFFDRASFDSRGFQDELLSAARYAQKVAIASQCPVQLVIDAGSVSYNMYLPNNTNPNTCATTPVFGTNPVQRPGGNAFAGVAPSGVTISNDLTVVFDSLGRPTSTANPITTTVGGLTITIEGETGYAH